MTTRESFPNVKRPVCWPGEEHHYRSTLQIGDLVRGQYGNLARIVAFNNTHSHIRGGRLVHLEAAGPGFDIHQVEFGHRVSWENELSPGFPGDRGAHPCRADGGYHWRHVAASWDGGTCPCSVV